MQPTNVACGPVGAADAGVGDGGGGAPGRRCTDACVVWSQLPLGMTRESSRMRRSQSKRVWAAVTTAARRCSLIEAKSV